MTFSSKRELPHPLSAAAAKGWATLASKAKAAPPAHVRPVGTNMGHPTPFQILNRLSRESWATRPFNWESQFFHTFLSPGFRMYRGLMQEKHPRSRGEKYFFLTSPFIEPAATRPPGFRPRVSQSVLPGYLSAFGDKILVKLLLFEDVIQDVPELLTDV